LGLDSPIQAISLLLIVSDRHFFKRQFSESLPALLTSLDSQILAVSAIGSATPMPQDSSFRKVI
jgi:hypothetical protein